MPTAAATQSATRSSSSSRRGVPEGPRALTLSNCVPVCLKCAVVGVVPNGGDCHLNFQWMPSLSIGAICYMLTPTSHYLRLNPYPPLPPFAVGGCGEQERSPMYKPSLSGLARVAWRAHSIRATTPGPQNARCPLPSSLPRMVWPSFTSRHGRGRPHPPTPTPGTPQEGGKKDKTFPLFLLLQLREWGL